jgi:dipeptide/tripeptide permease
MCPDLSLLPYLLDDVRSDGCQSRFNVHIHANGWVSHDLLSNINPLTLIILIPIMDRFVYPGLRKIGIKMLPITRITLGFFVGALAMAYCAIIQVHHHLSQELI